MWVNGLKYIHIYDCEKNKKNNPENYASLKTVSLSRDN